MIQFDLRDRGIGRDVVDVALHVLVHEVVLPPRTDGLSGLSG